MEDLARISARLTAPERHACMLLRDAPLDWPALRRDVVDKIAEAVGENGREIRPRAVALLDKMISQGIFQPRKQSSWLDLIVDLAVLCQNAAQSAPAPGRQVLGRSIQPKTIGAQGLTPGQEEALLVLWCIASHHEGQEIERPGAKLADYCAVVCCTALSSRQAPFHYVHHFVVNGLLEKVRHGVYRLTQAGTGLAARTVESWSAAGKPRPQCFVCWQTQIPEDLSQPVGGW